MILIIFYDYLPKRSIDLQPHVAKQIDVSVDSTVGGMSELVWLDKEKLHSQCDLKAAGTLSLLRNFHSVVYATPFEQLDFSSYDALEVDVEDKGQARYIRVFLRNYYPFPNVEYPIGKAKFNSISKATKNFEQLSYIPFAKLRLADWWIDDNQIPPEDIKPDVSQVIAVGIDLPHPTTFGRHVESGRAKQNSRIVTLNTTFTAIHFINTRPGFFQAGQ